MSTTSDKPPLPRTTPLAALETGTDHYRQRMSEIEVRRLELNWHLFKLGHFITVDVDRIARRFGLSIADIHLLGTIRVNAATMRANDLAQTLDVSPAALSTRVHRLVEDGLLLRSPHPTDRRAHQLRLTERGAEIADRSTECLARDTKAVQAYARLSSEELAELTRLLGELHEAFDRLIVTGAPDIG